MVATGKLTVGLELWCTPHHFLVDQAENNTNVRRYPSTLWPMWYITNPGESSPSLPTVGPGAAGEGSGFPPLHQPHSGCDAGDVGWGNATIVAARKSPHDKPRSIKGQKNSGGTPNFTPTASKVQDLLSQPSNPVAHFTDWLTMRTRREILWTLSGQLNVTRSGFHLAHIAFQPMKVRPYVGTHTVRSCCSHVRYESGLHLLKLQWPNSERPQTKLSPKWCIGKQPKVLIKHLSIHLSPSPSIFLSPLLSSDVCWKSPFLSAHYESLLLPLLCLTAYRGWRLHLTAD